MVVGHVYVELLGRKDYYGSMVVLDMTGCEVLGGRDGSEEKRMVAETCKQCNIHLQDLG